MCVYIYKTICTFETAFVCVCSYINSKYNKGHEANNMVTFHRTMVVGKQVETMLIILNHKVVV